MNCEHLSASGKFVYYRDCPSCAARLVVSARPSRPRQESMLYYIEKYWGMERERILSLIKSGCYDVTPNDNSEVSNDN